MSGDYTQDKIAFKLRKVFRYFRLYGINRTLAKVRGQYHMRSAEAFDGGQWVNANCRSPDMLERSVAIIGCGNYAFSNIAYYLSKKRRPFLRATYDVDGCKALSLCRRYGGAYATSDWKMIVDDPSVKTVFIASNHASHTEYAIPCIRAGKHVHIEKPHVVSEEQLDRLLDAMKSHPESKVFLGFNRPRSALFKRLQQQVRQESGPLMINWFIAGHQITDDHWYFHENEGGRVLGNLCHWTDLTLHLVTLERAFPCRILPATPAAAKSDFVVSVIFADQSCASITFSAKGHTFEGVREILNLHKGDTLATLRDFQCLTMDIVDRRERLSLWHRDHGHRENIVHSLLASESDKAGEHIRYVETTARFFLAIRHAIESGNTIEVK